jgi:predicted transcriptional regulator
MLQPKNIALQIQDTVPANYTDEDLADAIDMYLTQAAVSPQVYDRDIKPNFGQWMSNVKNELNRLQMANNPGVDRVGDMLRTSTDRYTKLREAIRELIQKELNEAGEKTAMVTTQSGQKSAIDYTSPDELNKLKDNTDIKSVTTGAGQRIK